MSLPDTFDPSGLFPEIVIYDENENPLYRYTESEKNITLKSWNISAGINSDAGSCEIVLDDYDFRLTNKIKPDYTLEVTLYRQRNQLRNRWFLGRISEVSAIRNGTNQQEIMISAYGYGKLLSSTYVEIHDKNLTSHKLSDIVKYALSDEAASIPPNLDLNTDNVADIDIEIPAYNAIVKPLATVLAELANVSNYIYYVDAYKNLHFHDLQQESGELITNDVIDDDSRILRNEEYVIKSTAIQRQISNLIATNVNVRITQTTTTTSPGTELQGRITDNSGVIQVSTRNKNEMGRDIKLTRDVTAIEVALISSNSRPQTANITWVITTRPTNQRTPSITDATAASGNISIQVSNRLTWMRLDYHFRKNTQYTLWIDAKNDRASILSARSGNLWFRTNPITRQNGEMRIRTPSNLPRFVPVTTTTTTPVERVAAIKARGFKSKIGNTDLRNLSNVTADDADYSLITSILSQGAKTRVVYDPVVVSVTDNIPPLGRRLRFIDSQNNVDTTPIIIGYDIGADHTSKLEAIDIRLELEDQI